MKTIKTLFSYRIANREKKERRSESKRGSRCERERETETVSAAIGKGNGGERQRSTHDEGVHQESLQTAQAVLHAISE